MGTSPTDDYLTFFLHFPIQNLFLLFLLGMARIVTIIAVAPFFGAKLLSNSMKMGFAIVLVPIFLPVFLVHIHTQLDFDFFFLMMIVKEVFIGFLLGLFLSMPYYIAQGAGNLIDHQRGAQSLQVTDPASQTQATPIGILYSDVMLISFFVIGGPFLFYDALLTSYKVIPIDAFMNAAFFSKEMPFWEASIKIFTSFISIAMQLAAPSLIMILMTDLFLGIANRMAPQVQISFLLWSLKAYLGIAILWAAWWLILQQLDIQSISWLKMLHQLVRGMGIQ